MQDNPHVILDLDDRCPWLPTDCEQPFLDKEGCPDLIVTFEQGGSTLTEEAQKAIEGVAAELARSKLIEEVEVMGYDNAQDGSRTLALARANAVILALTEAGANSERLIASAGRTPGEDPAYAAFFVVKCNPSD
jgi:hypothetical protein